ncbi:hypothetical protein ANO11243_066930 [Dothideomycetidae sp. 11243]|nr:hypothetical protein ANO11243_066930 [fungal sp. No.11243]
MSTPLSVHVVHPAKDHDSTVIFLHGRDSDASTFCSEIFESQSHSSETLPQLLPRTKWVFPSAPPLHSTRFGSDLSQWFDMYSTEDPWEKLEWQVNGLSENMPGIQTLMEDEAKLVGRDKLIVAGISQGAAISLHALLHSGHKVAGFVALSSWFAFKGGARQILDDCSLTATDRRDALVRLTESDALTNNPFPVFVAHCADDEVIIIEHGRGLRDALRGLGAPVEWHEYGDGGHWLNEPQGVDDLVSFIKSATSTWDYERRYRNN